MKALKAYNTEAITRFHQRKVRNTAIVETPQDDPPEPPVPENDLPDLPESDLDIPDDQILDFVNSQCHSSEDLDQALQAYQAYQVSCPQDPTMTAERSINHHFTYHIAQASQAKHGSLVDRGANGGLAGSDVRICSRSSRKCTVTGIDSHDNRILSKVQKSFWSCTHVNSCQNYTLYTNLYILLNILSKATLNIQESRKSIKRLKR